MPTMPHPLIDIADTKRRKVPSHLRKPQILAMQAAGMTQVQIAETLGVSRASITRDLETIRPAQEAVREQCVALMTEITSMLPMKDRAVKYVELAKHAKNEAVSLGALQRIDDLDGIVTEKERIRAKSGTTSEVQPMFVLPQGCNLSVTVNRNTMNVTAANDDIASPDTVNIDSRPTGTPR